jgi:hypothetical protein
MTARDVLEQFFAANPEYDGLVEPHGECGCKRGKIAPCSSPWDRCVLGHVVPCDCGNHDYHVMPGPRPK